MSYAATGGEVDVRHRGGLTDNDDAIRARYLLNLSITAIVLFASVVDNMADPTILFFIKFFQGRMG
jgi:hypothetical protein